MGSWGAQRTLLSRVPALKDIVGQITYADTAYKQQFEKCWGLGQGQGEGSRWEGEGFAHLRAWPRERRITERALQEQRSWQLPFSPPSA